MEYKKLWVLLAVLLFSGFAFAAPSGEPDVNVLMGDGNYYYPAKATTITWSARDENSPADANIVISYCLTTNCSAPTEIIDANSMTFCSSILSSTTQVCSYTWTLPPGLDANYYIDVNIFDISNADDQNDYSSSLYFDSNACDSYHSVSGVTVTLGSVCTGLSGDQNTLFGDTTIYYRRGGLGLCTGSHLTYTGPFDLPLGRIAVCYYSTDGVGNTETEVGFMQTVNSGVVSMIGILPLILAALLLVAITAIAGVFVARGEMDTQTIAAISVAGVIVILMIIVIVSII